MRLCVYDRYCRKLVLLLWLTAKGYRVLSRSLSLISNQLHRPENLRHDTFPGCQIICLLHNLVVHDSFHKSPSGPILSHYDPIHTLIPFQIFKITPTFPKWSPSFRFSCSSVLCSRIYAIRATCLTQLTLV
jgi:hypothetical protein